VQAGEREDCVHIVKIERRGEGGGSVLVRRQHRERIPREKSRVHPVVLHPSSPWISR
jgi:hypothetical protein